MIEHALQAHEVDSAASPEVILASPENTEKLFEALSTAIIIVDDIASKKEHRGYIFARRQKQTKESTTEAKDLDGADERLIYEDFQPFVPKKFQENNEIAIIELNTFNGTVDQFFSSLEEQKLETRMSDRAATAQNRFDVAKRDQDKRITVLKESQVLKSRMAAAIEANIERVTEAIDSVNSLLSQGMDWIDIGKLIERETKRKNPIASTISLPLKLESNVITLMLFEADGDDKSLLSESSDESDSELQKLKNGNDEVRRKPKPLLVDVSLALTPWSNAREYHDQRRSAAVKEGKTQIQSQSALRSAEQKIQSDLKKGLKQEKALLQPIRNQLWFEKFFWFISSDGYLVLAGRDPAQQELLYKRYLRYGDVLCHADIANASAAIIKNDPHSPDAPIPPTTLSQAGSFAVCSSSAWDSKAGMGSWWVSASQVSKLSLSGEVLPMGEFAVRGEKNHLPPGPLLLGLGVVFKISNTSRSNHMNNEMKAYVASSALLKGENYDIADEALHNDDEEEEEEHEQEEEEPAQCEEPQESTGSGEYEYNDASHLSDSTSVKTRVLEEKELELEEKQLINIDNRADSVAKPTPDSLAITISDVTSDEPKLSLDKTEARELKRGQKNKTKKAAMKYKDQDDEDKAAAVALLGTKLGIQRAEARAKQRRDQTIQLGQKIEQKQAQKFRDDQATLSEEKKRESAMEQGSMTDKGFLNVISALSALVGTPAVGDEIEHLSVICAPISSLSRMKYKVKLQPGPQKRGKLVKEILERWKIDAGKKGSVDDRAMDTSRMWPREVELIKALKAEDVVNAVPVGKARIMISGGSSTKGDPRKSNANGVSQKKKK